MPLKVSIGIMKTVISILDNLGRPDSGRTRYTSGFPRDYGLILPGPLECLLLVLSIVSQVPDHDIPSCTPTFSIFMQSFIAYTDNIQSATYGPPQSQQSKTLVTRITELCNGPGSNNFFAPEHLEYLNDKFGIILPSEEDPPPDISAEAPSMNDKSDRVKRHRRMSQAAVSFPRLPINHSLPSLRPSSMNSSSTAPPISISARPDTHTVPPNSTLALPQTISTDGNVEIREVEHLPASSSTATGARDDDELEQPRLSTKFRDESATL
ncbi:hypothetical protein C8Q75DRAFT_764494 [Abortiporus biennis]|nr:hypothetical protein C8Q75DRAFT_764494 [Abortiporus biennis]